MKNRKIRPCPGPGYRLVFSKSIRTRSGKVIYAWQYGLAAFAFWVKA